MQISKTGGCRSSGRGSPGTPELDTGLVHALLTNRRHLRVTRSCGVISALGHSQEQLLQPKEKYQTSMKHNYAAITDMVVACNKTSPTATAACGDAIARFAIAGLASHAA